MKIQCPDCTQSSELHFPAPWVEFACPHCKTLFSKSESGGLTRNRMLPTTPVAMGLQLADQGFFEGSEWEIGAVCVKKPVDYHQGWVEYTLYNPAGEIKYLSEYDGHWLLAKEVEGTEKYQINEVHGIYHEGEFYKIYHDTEYTTEYAAGFFDYPVNVKGLAKDFISPPKALLLEQTEGQPTFAFEARYMTRKELLAAFPQANPPKPGGQGMLQPFPIDLNAFWGVLGSAAALIFLIQIVLSGFYPSQEVLTEHVVLPDTVAEVTHISPSFTTTGIIAPLKIELSAPVNNSWAAVDFTLVNDDTQEQRFGSVEIAYYHGSGSDGTWTEGTDKPSIKICGVKPGRYHLEMQVVKEPNKPAINALRYRATAQAATFGNLFLALGMVVVGLIAVYIWRYNFEQQRWLNSDFPPETGEA